MKYLGEIADGRDVNIGNNSPNEHIIITGISGSGKSVRIMDIEQHIINDRGTAIAIDMDGTHIENEDLDYQHICAQEDGLDLRILDMSRVNEGKETMTNLKEYIIETICPRQLRGACQLAAVRKAVEFALCNRSEFSSDMEAIAYGLKEQEEAAALGAYNHLCPILEGDIFRKSSKKILEGKINVISLKGLNPKTQKRIVEIFLGVMWRQMRIEGRSEKKITLILDEFQNLDFYPGSTLFQMLTEVRKYGVNLILSTQTLTIFSKKELAIINQAATKLFFQQSSTDLKKVSELIETGHKDKWISALSRLRIGQAVTVGKLEIGGRQLHQPVITCSAYNKPGTFGVLCPGI